MSTVDDEEINGWGVVFGVLCLYGMAVLIFWMFSCPIWDAVIYVSIALGLVFALAIIVVLVDTRKVPKHQTLHGGPHMQDIHEKSEHIVREVRDLAGMKGNGGLEAQCKWQQRHIGDLKSSLRDADRIAAIYKDEIAALQRKVGAIELDRDATVLRNKQLLTECAEKGRYINSLIGHRDRLLMDNERLTKQMVARVDLPSAVELKETREELQTLKKQHEQLRQSYAEVNAERMKLRGMSYEMSAQEAIIRGHGAAFEAERSKNAALTEENERLRRKMRQALDALKINELVSGTPECDATFITAWTKR